MERREIRYSGRVQGVGFRQTVKSISGRFPVGGFVENLPSGDVLLVVEGEPGDIDAFLSAVRAEFDRFIQSERPRRGEPTGDFSDFAIRI